MKSLLASPGIEAVIDRYEGESVKAFKQRCGAFLLALTPPEEAFAVGRFTVLGNGQLKNDQRWGSYSPICLPIQASRSP